MIIYKGNKGLNNSWQESFKENIKCKSCGENARIMFVAMETIEKDWDYICNLHENMKDGKLWLHDAMAVALYLCEKCFEVSGEINQA